MGKLSILGAMLIAGISCGCTSSKTSYFRNGVGSELSYAETEMQSASNTEGRYLAFLCERASSMVGGSGCMEPKWNDIVFAGMNDIDERCDNYLSWLDAKRRNAAAIQNQIGDAQTFTTAVLTATQVGTTAIGLVGAAFGFARDSFENANSRLLMEVNHTTVQAIVLKSQSNFRKELNTIVQAIPIASRPSAVFVLRQYLRICMPFTIENQINTAASLYVLGNDPKLANAATPSPLSGASPLDGVIPRSYSGGP